MESKVSDHFPVRLSFHNPSLERGVRKAIPSWLATHPTFLKQVREKWAQTKHPINPAKRLVLFKKIVKCIAWPALTEKIAL